MRSVVWPPVAQGDAGGNSGPASRNPLPEKLQIAGIIEALVSRWSDPTTLAQRRQRERERYTRTLAVTPLEGGTLRPCGEAIPATGRDISPAGVSFSHSQPLPYRIVAVTFRLDTAELVSLAACLSWCRFARDGSYCSGGKLQRVLPQPVVSSRDWTSLAKANSNAQAG